MSRQCLCTALTTLILALTLQNCSSTQRVLIDEWCPSLCENYNKTAFVFEDETLTDVMSCEDANSILPTIPKSSSDCDSALGSWSPACGCEEKCSLCESYNKTATVCANDNCTETTSCEKMSFLLGHMHKNSSECSEALSYYLGACGCKEKCPSLCENYNETKLVCGDLECLSQKTCKEINSILPSFGKQSQECVIGFPYFMEECDCEEKCPSLCENYNKTAFVFKDETLTDVMSCEDANSILPTIPKSSSDCDSALGSWSPACGCVEKCSLCDSYNKAATVCANDNCTETTSCEKMSFLLGHMHKNSSECSEALPSIEASCGCVEKCSLCDTYDQTAMVYVDESLTDKITCQAMSVQLEFLPKNSSECSEYLPFVEGACGCVDKNVEKCSLCENYNKTATTFLDDEKKFEVTCEKAMSVVGGLAKDSKDCKEILPILQVNCGCKELCIFCSGGVPKNPNATTGPFPNSDMPEKQTCLEFGAYIASIPSDSEDCKTQKMAAETCGCPIDPKTNGDSRPSATSLSQCRFIFVLFLGFFSLWW